MRKVFVGLIRFLVHCLLRIEIRGVENIPPRGGALVAANHPSLADGILLYLASPRPLRFLVGAEVCKGPVAWLVRWFRAIPVDRRGGDNGRALAQAREALTQGEVIGIFPEGKLNGGGPLHPFKKGVAVLALTTGVPVVPCGFVGTEKVLPKGSSWPRAAEVEIFFGPTIAALPERSQVPDRELDQWLDNLHTKVSALAGMETGLAKRKRGWLASLHP